MPESFDPSSADLLAPDQVFEMSHVGDETSHKNVVSVRPDHVDSFEQTHSAFEDLLSSHEELEGGEVMSIQLDEEGVLHGIVKMGKQFKVVRQNAIEHMQYGEAGETIHDADITYKKLGRTRLGLAITDDEGQQTRYAMNRRGINKDNVEIRHQIDPERKETTRRIGSTVTHQVLRMTREREELLSRKDHQPSPPTSDAKPATQSVAHPEELQARAEAPTPEDLSLVTNKLFERLEAEDVNGYEEKLDEEGNVIERSALMYIPGPHGRVHTAKIVERVTPGREGKTTDFIYSGGDDPLFNMRAIEGAGDDPGKLVYLAKKSPGTYKPTGREVEPHMAKAWMGDISRFIEDEPNASVEATEMPPPPPNHGPPPPSGPNQGPPPPRNPGSSSGSEAQPTVVSPLAKPSYYSPTEQPKLTERDVNEPLVDITPQDVVNIPEQGKRKNRPVSSFQRNTRSAQNRTNRTSVAGRSRSRSEGNEQATTQPEQIATEGFNDDDEAFLSGLGISADKPDTEQPLSPLEEVGAQIKPEQLGGLRPDDRYDRDFLEITGDDALGINDMDSSKSQRRKSRRPQIRASDGRGTRAQAARRSSGRRNRRR